MFDLRATWSFLAKSQVEDLKLSDFEHVSYTVAVPLGKLYCCDKLFKNVPLKIRKVIFPNNIHVMEMEGLDIILGMDWLSKFIATINVENKE